MSRSVTNSTPNQQHGAGIIEVMVALFVLAIGLLGFVGLQTEGITLGRQAYMHSQAIFLAQDLVERIRANRTSTTVHNLYALNYNETASSGTDCSSSGSSCSPEDLANWDRADWSTRVAQALPGGVAQVIVTPADGVTSITVNIRYRLAQGRLTQGQAAPSEEESTYVYTLETQI